MKEEKSMAQIFVKYNPYRLETEIKVNGNIIEVDSSLYNLVKRISALTGI